MTHRPPALGSTNHRPPRGCPTAARRPRILASGAVASLALLLACSDGYGRDAGYEAGPIVSFEATPATLRPDVPVTLRPVFTRGAGRVEPDVGPVESGGSYVVGPFTTARAYTLVVTDGATEHRRTLELPFAYAQAIRPIAPSPLARVDHTMVRLQDGRVLVVGGRSPGPTGWTTTELFDPATGTFTPSGELLVTRWNTPAVLLPGGDVLLLGGETNFAQLEAATSVQRWDAASSAWSVAGHLLEHRIGPTATLLPGGEVLVVGGFASQPEIFDPESGESRRPAGEMVQPRLGHTATPLSDGRVLIAGGWTTVLGEVLEAEVFDPETESFTPTGLLHVGRGNHLAQRLADGRVLLAGGDTLIGDPVELTPTATAEIWDPATGEFTPTGSLAAGRALAASARLADGSVLVAGGFGPDNVIFAEIEIFDPLTGQWTRPASLPSPRVGLALAALEDGRVLLTGGSPGNDFPVLAGELYE